MGLQLEAIEKQRQQAIAEQAALEKQAGRIGAARLAAMLVVFLGPVSYTHLDVYKRQAQGSAFLY